MPHRGFDSRDRQRRRSPSIPSESDTTMRRRDRDDREYRNSRRRDDYDDHGSTRDRYSSRRDREGDRRERDRSPKRRRRSYSREDFDREEREERRRHKRRGDRSGSQERRRRRRSPSSRSPDRPRRSSRSQSPSSSSKRSRGPLPSQEESFRGQGSSKALSRRDPGSERRGDGGNVDDAVAKTSPSPEKQKPNFERTGALARETNTVEGTNIVLKYNEPPEARKPSSKDAWRLYVFKGSDLLETVEIFTRSCWLVGRERMVADFPIDHPSCSKQHAVIQFRHIVKTNEYGDKDARVRPYIIDLDSANGTKVNGEKIPATRYVELQDKDMIQFGLSTREYVLMLPPR